MKAAALPLQYSAQRIHAFWLLTKPRVISLIVFCALIGMLLASPHGLPLHILVAATVGIAFVAGAAAAMNCLIEQQIDEAMARTRARPLPQGSITAFEAFFFSGVLGGLGLSILYRVVNPLTMWLTLGTFVGYALIYTIYLKPRTSQNIVIGGAAGAMPPVLGWAAATGETPFQAWILFLIIFIWTPPHFWSLALYRVKEYAAAGLPMLPVTHGAEYTRKQVFLYTLALCAVTLLPYFDGMSGLTYLLTVLVLNGVFLHHAWKVWRHYSDEVAKKAFRWSIIYLTILFAALLVDRML